MVTGYSAQQTHPEPTIYTSNTDLRSGQKDGQGGALITTRQHSRPEFHPSITISSQMAATVWPSIL